MIYERDRQTEWVAWFLDPATTGEQELRDALTSVPQRFEHWTVVMAELEQGISELKGAHLKVSGSVPAECQRITDADHQAWATDDLKERRFREVLEHRQPGAIRDSLSKSKR